MRGRKERARERELQESHQLLNPEARPFFYSRNDSAESDDGDVDSLPSHRQSIGERLYPRVQSLHPVSNLNKVVTPPYPSSFSPLPSTSPSLLPLPPFYLSLPSTSPSLLPPPFYLLLPSTSSLLSTSFFPFLPLLPIPLLSLLSSLSLFLLSPLLSSLSPPLLFSSPSPPYFLLPSPFPVLSLSPSSPPVFSPFLSLFSLPFLPSLCLSFSSFSFLFSLFFLLSIPSILFLHHLPQLIPSSTSLHEFVTLSTILYLSIYSLEYLFIVDTTRLLQAK